MFIFHINVHTHVHTNAYTSCYNTYIHIPCYNVCTPCQLHISYSILSFPFHHSIELARPGENENRADASSDMQQSLFAELQGVNNTEGFEPMRGNMMI